jgi:hypothetical protein
MLVFDAWAVAQGVDRAAAPAPPASASSPAPADIGGVIVIAPRPKPEPAWAKTFNFDVRGIYAPSAEPYLRERPVDSCKPMAGGAKPGFAGRTGFASGLVCVKRF